MGSACAAIMNAVAFIVALRERRLVCPEGTAWRGPVWFPPERSEKQSSIESMAASFVVVVVSGFITKKTLEDFTKRQRKVRSGGQLGDLVERVSLIARRQW